MRLVLCDRNRILCEALAAVLETRGHRVLAIVPTAAESVAAVGVHQPDACLIDLHFSGAGDGLTAARAIRQQHPGTAVVILSGTRDPVSWSQARKIGVAGLLRKDQNVDQITHALKIIEDGGLVFDPTIPRGSSTRVSRAGRLYPLCVLTPREKEVLGRIVAGQSTEQMASEMNITISTLRTYVKSVLTKLGAHTRLEAAAAAARGGLLEPSVA